MGTMRVKKLLHTRMRVSDMDQTINFYTNVLGLRSWSGRSRRAARIWLSSKCPTARN